MRYIGIDPGVSGGMAVISCGGGIIAVTKMPNTQAGILGFLREHAVSDYTRAALEFVRTTPQMGVVSAGTFMRNYGHCEMALTAAGVAYYDVHPRRWQARLNCLSRGDKNVTKAHASGLWPDYKITHAIADALLLAEWCRLNTINGSKGNP